MQKIKGTKVTFTIFSDKMPEPFLTEIGGGEYTDEAIEAYAKAYCKDSMDKYSYDGIDVDYEPGYGASGPFVGALVDALVLAEVLALVEALVLALVDALVLAEVLALVEALVLAEVLALVDALVLASSLKLSDILNDSLFS